MTEMKTSLPQVSLVFLNSGDTYPLDDRFREFPWRAQWEEICRGNSPRRMIAIHAARGELVGAMAVDETKEVPELIFFEVVREERRKGYGKSALLEYIRLLKEQGYEKLFVQTGRTVIYRRMGFKFIPVERRGLIIHLDDPLAELEASKEVRDLVLVHANEYTWHDNYMQPEDPHRISVTIQWLHRHPDVLEKVSVVPPRYAEVEEIEMVHKKEYIESVRIASEQGKSLGPNNHTCFHTYDIARLAFGGALLAGENIDHWKKVFVLCRPPGHHALPDQAMGFCFFNNIAGLALYLYHMGIFPLVLDWDIHHGNGTQSVLYQLPIPFISIHQKYLFPFTGDPSEKGEGKGKGYNHNFFVPPFCKDELYLDVFRQAVELIREYRPDVVLVSAGQDGHKEDKLSGTLLTTECYRQMMLRVRDVVERYCSGRVILVLEGGYNLESLAEANGAIIQVLCD